AGAHRHALGRCEPDTVARGPGGPSPGHDCRRRERGDHRVGVHVRPVRHGRRHAVLVPRGHAARGDGRSATRLMIWLIVAGDLTPLGGMDAANHALARYLASRDEIHLVTHRAWPDLEALPNVPVHRVWRPFGRHLLGAPLLSRTGQRVWRRLGTSNAKAIVNGGNCPIAGVNWVHYLHAADTLSSA